MSPKIPSFDATIIPNEQNYIHTCIYNICPMVGQFLFVCDKSVLIKNGIYGISDKLLQEGEKALVLKFHKWLHIGDVCNNRCVVLFAVMSNGLKSDYFVQSSAFNDTSFLEAHFEEIHFSSVFTVLTVQPIFSPEIRHIESLLDIHSVYFKWKTQKHYYAL